MTIDEIEELIRRYLSTGIAVVVILVAPGADAGDVAALPGNPQVITVEPGTSSDADAPPAADRRGPAPAGEPGPARAPADETPGGGSSGGTDSGSPDSRSSTGSGSGSGSRSGDSDRTDSGTGDDNNDNNNDPLDDRTGAAGTDLDRDTGSGGDSNDSGDTGRTRTDESGSDQTGSDQTGSDQAGSGNSSDDTGGSGGSAGREDSTGEEGSAGQDDSSRESTGDEDSDAPEDSADQDDTADRDDTAGREDSTGVDSNRTDSTRAGAGSDTAGSGTSRGGGKAGSGSTAAERFGWGTPDREDDFSGGTDQWDIYDGPGHAGQGTRSPSAVSVEDGVLAITGDSSGTTAGMAWNPGQKYGRWEGRVRAPASDPSYNALLLLWPDAEDFPVGGEIDFMEMMDPSRQKTDLFLHYGADNSQDNGQVEIDGTQWHTWALEWTPEAITAYVDGEEWYRTTDTSIFPPGPMHLCIQLDWFPKGDTPKESVMYVDWVRQYSLDGDGSSGDSGGSRGARGISAGPVGAGPSPVGGTGGDGHVDARGGDDGHPGGGITMIRDAIRRIFMWR